MTDKNRSSVTPHPEGIVFGLPETRYHADPSLGSSGLTLLMKSAADYWWASSMNDTVDEQPDRDAAHFRLGSALHKLVFEGEAAFDASYAVGPDVAAFPGLMKTADDLRDYLRHHGLPTSGAKAALLDRVRRHWRATQSPEAFCPIWDDILAGATEGGRKRLLTAQEARDIRVRARMLVSNPALAGLHSDPTSNAVPRFAEVSVFWRERVLVADGGVVEVPCKARFDSLGLNSIIDLKTMSNTKGVALSLAIPQQIHAMAYDLQAAHYMTARERARRFVTKGNVLAIDDESAPPDYWLRAFARIKPAAIGDNATALAWRWFWIFVQSSGAPVAECRTTGWDSPLITRARAYRTTLLRRFADNAVHFGTGMWPHESAIQEIRLTDMPKWPRFQSDDRDGEFGR